MHGNGFRTTMSDHKPSNIMNSTAQIRRPRRATGIPRICSQIHDKFTATFDMCKYGVTGSY